MPAKHLLLACSLIGSAASAQVYIDDVAFASSTFGHGALTYLESLSSGGQGACGFAFDSIDSGGLATRIAAINIAEGYSLFVVADETVFNAAYVSNHAAIVNNAGTLPAYTIPYDDQPVLFAYWDDRSSFGGTGTWAEVDDSDLFGWMRIAFSLGTDPDTLQPAVRWTILDSATARGGGIIAGTYTQVPEPASVSLFLGLAVLAPATTRRRSRASQALALPR